MRRASPCSPSPDVALGEALLFEVLLMIFLRSPELLRRDNLGDNGLWKSSRSLQAFLRSARGGILLRIVCENHRPVLRSHVRSLAVERRGVVALPENLEQLLVSDLGRVELDFHDFRVPGTVRAYILIGRAFELPAHITDRCRSDARGLTKRRLYSPKTSRRKCRLLHVAPDSF